MQGELLILITWVLALLLTLFRHRENKKKHKRTNNE